jgi:4-hydroxybenzoate polyprenyltransferase
MDIKAEVHSKPITVWTFTRAALSELWTYFAYGGGAVLLTFWGYLTKQVPPAWVFLGVIAIGFLVGAFRTWQKERIDRNVQVASVVKLERKVDVLGRSCFVPEITDVVTDGYHQQPE